MGPQSVAASSDLPAASALSGSNSPLIPATTQHNGGGMVNTSSRSPQLPVKQSPLPQHTAESPSRSPPTLLKSYRPMVSPNTSPHHVNNLTAPSPNAAHLPAIKEDEEQTFDDGALTTPLTMVEAIKELYVDEASISKHLKCTICTLPYTKPICHEACGNVFCSSCVTEWQGNCPCCRKPFKDRALLIANVPLRSMLDELRIKCPSCSSQMRRDQLPAHTRAGCKAANAVQCRQQCGAKLVGTYEAEHIEEHCSQTNKTCEAVDIGCDWTGIRADHEQHRQVCKLLAAKYAFTAAKDAVEEQDRIIRLQKVEIQQLKKQAKRMRLQLDAANLSADEASPVPASNPLNRSFSPASHSPSPAPNILRASSAEARISVIPDQATVRVNNAASVQDMANAIANQLYQQRGNAGLSQPIQLTLTRQPSGTRRFSSPSITNRATSSGSLSGASSVSASPNVSHGRNHDGQCSVM